jgi:hypothetical protein
MRDALIHRGLGSRYHPIPKQRWLPPRHLVRPHLQALVEAMDTILRAACREMRSREELPDENSYRKTKIVPTIATTAFSAIDIALLVADVERVGLARLRENTQVS